MKSNDKFSNIISGTNKNVIRVLIGIMTFALLPGSIYLIYVVYREVIDESPHFLLLDVTSLINIFSSVLIIAVGYELIKSLMLIISSDNIPTVPIIQIAIVAVANKIITLDLKHAGPLAIIGLAILIAVLGLAHFLLQYYQARPD
jgi:uncharacterized membrane protein (DUF373 family)